MKQFLELSETADPVIERKQRIIKSIQGDLEKSADELMKVIKGGVNYAEIKVACNGILDLVQTRERLEKEVKSLEKKTS
jgi:chaperonin cofactor prefoldin